MFSKRLSCLCAFYCISPLHAGSGQATGAVDLPIQRERHTGWPHVQASGVKGAFRHWFQRYYENNGAPSADKDDQAFKLTNRIFGADETGEDLVGQAGAVVFSDARLLAFPVRSSIAPFVWVTCPAALDRLQRDLQLVDMQLAIPRVKLTKDDSYLCVNGALSQDIVLEDLAVSCDEAGYKEEIAQLQKAFHRIAPDLERLVLVSDQHFSFLVRTATEVQPQIRINAATGTADEGSLRYQELLPADSFLYSVVFFDAERVEDRSKQEDAVLAAEAIKDYVTKAVSTHIQMGGDATLGRGLMKVKWLPETGNGGGAI